MGRMFGLRSKGGDMLAPPKTDNITSRPATPVKRMSQISTRAITPPLPISRSKRDSMSPLSSVESTPKTSFDGDHPALSASRIHFASQSLPEYDDMFAITIDNVLSREECQQLIRDAEDSAGSMGWESATGNADGDNQTLVSQTRNCSRIVWDSQEAVDRIWERISDLPELQEIMTLQDNAGVTGNGPARRNEIWQLTRANEHMRFLKYQEGEYFSPHCDATYETFDRSERSYYTMHVYLNDQGAPTPQQLRGLSKEERKAAQKDYLMGGNTAFHSYDNQRCFKVAPKMGSILIFQHRNLLHSGTNVLQGTKYTMRTDLMYKKL